MIAQADRHPHANDLDRLAARFVHRFDVPHVPFPSLRNTCEPAFPALDHPDWYFRNDLSLPFKSTGVAVRGTTIWEGRALCLCDEGGLIYGAQFRGSVVGHDLLQTKHWHIKSLGGYLILRYFDAMQKALNTQVDIDKNINARQNEPPEFWAQVSAYFLMLGDGFWQSLTDWLDDTPAAQDISKALFAGRAASGPWFEREIRKDLASYASSILTRAYMKGPK